MEQNTALLVMDMQSAILQNLPDATSLTDNVVKAIAYARERKMIVVYVVVGFRAGAPEISSNNKSFAPRKQAMTADAVEAWMKIHPSVTTLQDDIVVIKRRVSAFIGSDL